jgi:outer membrane protein
MRLRVPRWLRSIKLFAFLWPIFLLMISVFMISTSGRAERIPLERAVRLALAHSTSAAIADADVQRAFASYREVRNAYIPQAVAGSGIGYSQGYPVSIEGQAPSVLNVVAQSSVLNLAQQQTMHAAKTDWVAAQYQDKDQRNVIIQDVVSSYTELAKWQARLARLQQDEAESQKMEHAVNDRLQAGVDSTLDLNKAKLTTAKMRLHRIQARGSADVLLKHLANLTGVPVSSIEIEADSIPSLPPVASEEDTPEKAAALSPAVKSAELHSLAEAMRASSEHRALLPSVDFSAQYALFSNYNNYAAFFPAGAFRQNNTTIGAGIRIPIFNATQRARAQAADAEALKAKKQAEAARNQMSEETLRLQRAVEQLEATRVVVELQYQLAQSGLEAAQTRIDSNLGTLHELDDARVNAAEFFLAFQDADFEYQRARVNLLRATGDLEKWALAK